MSKFCQKALILSVQMKERQYPLKLSIYSKPYIMRKSVLSCLWLFFAWATMSFEGGCGNREAKTDPLSTTTTTNTTNPNNETDMKWINNLLGGGNYDAAWKEVDKAEQNGLTEDAQKLVQAIYERAKAENHTVQIIKALLHRYKFSAYNEENSDTKAIQSLRDEISTATTAPLKPILQSVLAEAYWQYFEAQRYAILQRSDAQGIGDDFKAWDANRFTTEITALHRAALQQPEQLQKISLSDIDPIVVDGDDDSRKLRPTLYDFLAHRALDYFMNDQADITKAADQFQISDAAVFADAKTFAQTQWSNTDPLSVKYYALILLQQLSQFHLRDNQPDALIDVSLKRLSYAKQKSTLPDRSQRYIKALEVMSEQYKAQKAAAEIYYPMAQWHYDKAAEYDPFAEANSPAATAKTEYKKALEICYASSRQYAGTRGAKNCDALSRQINQKELSFQAEQANLPDQALRALVSYRNINQVYARVLMLTDDISKKADAMREERDRLEYYRSLAPNEKWTIELPKDDDLHRHSTEIKIPALPIGNYLLMIGTAEDMSGKNNAFAYQRMSVTNLALLTREKSYTKTTYLAVHRNTGNPLANIDYETYLQTWDYRSNQYKHQKLSEGKTDKNGMFEAPTAKDQYGNLKIVIRNGKDKYEHNDYLRQDGEYTEYDRHQTFFFTDRAIYRPGQTVFFKGITLLLKPNNQHEVAVGQATTVTLYDANHQEAAKLDLKTNEYGSFNGKFVLPSNLLNGSFSLSSAYGSANFQVEEYKRPKFAVSFEPIKGSYRLNESITAKGNAKAFAGNNIDGATVKYRVVRTASFPWWGWWCWWRIPDAASNALEIEQGSTTTDADGNFSVTFTALPDLTLDPTQKPQYTYQIIADVTDINGETRSQTANVEVGYVSLLVNADISDNFNQRKPDATIGISSTNLSGQPEAASLNIVVYELQQPKRLLRPRLWQRPDKFLMTEPDFVRYFPNDVYDNEDNYATWKRGETLLDKNINTATDSTINLSSLRAAKVGKYVLEITGKDKFGEKVTWKKLFTLYDPSGSKIPETALLWSMMDKTTLEPAEVALLAYGSSAKDAKIWLEISRNQTDIRHEWLSASESLQQLSQKIPEEWRGGFGIRLASVCLNRFQQQTYTVVVPWTNKELTIEKESFRSKLYPGQAEEWRFKISGAKSEKIAAEMVATLYDASLDEFITHQFGRLDIYPSYGNWGNVSPDHGFSVGQSNLLADGWNSYGSSYETLQYDYLNWFGFNLGYGGGHRYYTMQMRSLRRSRDADDGRVYKSAPASMPPPAPAGGAMKNGEMANMVDMAVQQEAKMAAPVAENDEAVKAGGNKNTATDFGDVKVRSNLQELAFFMPELRTNEKGEVIMAFTMPEALTKWRLLGLAHTKDAKIGQIDASTITQKDLMVQPNLPRFLREGDQIYLSTKIANLTEQDLKGEAVLQLFNATTMQPIDAALKNTNNVLPFTAKAKQSTAVEWSIQIPADIPAVVCRMVAKSGKVSDGEETPLPVLTNRMLVTESMPLPIRGATSRQFKFDNLAKANASNTLSHHSLTVEMTSNPAWYAVQALPYLMEYPYECTEQIFSRYYANSIAQHVANSSPDIKKVFDTWIAEARAAAESAKGKDAAGTLLSNLEKNQELKQVMLEETPWVMQAKDEAERKRRVGLLFDLERMSSEMERAEKELLKRQTPSGGWTWFPGMPDDRYITQHIVCGLGHLDRLGVRTVRENPEIWAMLQRAVRVLDQKMQEDYDWLIRNKANLSEDHTGYTLLHYLYTRSFFRDLPLDDAYQKAFNYYKGQSEKYWLNKGTYMNAMTALALHRQDNGDNKAAQDIMKSLRQNTVKNEEMGMYFKDNRGGWYWYQAPIETQALAIEAFDEVSNDATTVNELKVWLLKQKQTQDWKTTKATAEACYALLLRGGKWLASKDIVEVVIGSHQLPKSQPDLKLEAGTGYYKTRWNAPDITADMGNISVTKKDEGVSWGAVYWQYFEQLDKITRAETPLTITKQLFKETATKSGLQLQPLSNGAKLKVGDMLKVRIEIRVDRDMEYVHLKDMRAAGFEPTNVLSRYRWQDGLGYYESTKDAATNFFMHWLPQGTYVFEYPLRVSHKGNFSNGITTMQSMYAPEFTSHSEGIRVKVE